MMEPFDVFDAGRMAVFADPSGAVFMAWKPNQMIGAYIVNEPETLSWNELQTRDPAGAKEFYAKVFGWQSADMDFGGGTYTVWYPPGVEPARGQRSRRDDRDDRRPVAGGRPPELARLLRRRGHRRDGREGEGARRSAVVGAFDIEGVGRIAVLSDPNGAVFAVIKTQMPADD